MWVATATVGGCLLGSSLVQCKQHNGKEKIKMKTLTNDTYQTMVEVAIRVATDNFTDKGTQSFAKIAPLLFDDFGNPVVVEADAEYGADVYDLIEAVESKKKYNHYAVFTCGWAAPINKDQDDDDQVAPSQHPERRRVQLVLVTSRDGKQASALRFDKETELVTDEGNARGSLAEAFADIFN
jgi:hypothetical protein